MKQCIFLVPVQTWVEHHRNGTHFQLHTTSGRMIWLNDVATGRHFRKLCHLLCPHASYALSLACDKKLNAVNFLSSLQLPFTTFLGYFNLSAYFSQLFPMKLGVRARKVFFFSPVYFGIFSIFILFFRIPLDLTWWFTFYSKRNGSQTRDILC